MTIWMSIRKITVVVAYLLAAVANSGFAGQKVTWPDTVWLTSLDLTKMHQGWGQPQKDKSVTERPLSIAGHKFQRGVGTHAVSRLWVDLGGNAEMFLASVGVDDDALNNPGSVVFKVVGDGKKLWESEIKRPGDAAKKVSIDIHGIKYLVLLVGDAGDGVSYDHADWADAMFVMHRGKPEAIEPPGEEKVILTPRPGARPRINGAKIFGVHPGAPFLFTIPATGMQPMKYAVKNLPTGLAVNSETGQITGSLDKPGKYFVKFVVSNDSGVAEREFRIVCGDTLALTPHMGWNSWYVWENHVTDGIMRAAADAMVKTGMINHGYMYVNVDDCWAVKPGSDDSALGGPPRDSRGMVNSNKRFPDMRALTAYIHSKGLKAGIYTSPGPTTCAGHVGAYQHEELDVQRFVEWGFDFLKYDWCSYDDVARSHNREELQKPYRLIGGILKKQNRDIVLNLCQYGMGNVWEWGRDVGGNSWRTAGDLGGSFEGIAAALFRDGFDVYARNDLHRYSGPGGWNDPDYLLLGYLSNWHGETVPTPLTPNEQYTHVSLWCLLSAPLIFSGDITRLDEFTLSLLTNDEVIEVDQDPMGKAGRRIWQDEDVEVWAKDLEDGSKAVGLFNRGEFESTVTAKWNDLTLAGDQRVRDLWRQKDLGVFKSEFSSAVPRHGVVLLRIWPAN